MVPPVILADTNLGYFFNHAMTIDDGYELDYLLKQAREPCVWKVIDRYHIYYFLAVRSEFSNWQSYWQEAIAQAQSLTNDQRLLYLGPELVKDNIKENCAHHP